ncbi:MAG: hypothetical protein M3265_09365 [Actinomycetota bacterium]|nr:hypothetical protein [Actinomycetota bacterium]
MTEPRPPRPDLFQRRRGHARLNARRSRRRRIGIWAAGLVFAAVVFFLGVALGIAVAETPPPGGTQTFVRTLEPETLPPVTRTVTVTTASS